MSNAFTEEGLDAWIGRSWVETVGDGQIGGDKVRRMVEHARASRVSAFRQVTQRFPSALELPIEYTTVRSGKGGLIAIGKNLQAVAELQYRGLVARGLRRDAGR